MKGVIASGISVALFKNPVTVRGITGYMVTVAGVVAYSEVRQLPTEIQAWRPGQRSSRCCLVEGCVLDGAHLICWQFVSGIGLLF